MDASATYIKEGVRPLHPKPKLHIPAPEAAPPPDDTVLPTRSVYFIYNAGALPDLYRT